MQKYEKEIIIDEFEDINEIKENIKNIYNVELSYSDVINLVIMDRINNLDFTMNDVAEQITVLSED